tara:strand:- start:3859 stop:4302 length:444 start_codon:yes stop_codon:yes gene_type:complete
MIYKYNKKGWIRILEATIAVLIVTSVLVVVYSNQNRPSDDLGEYFFNLQKQILRDISLKNDLRSYVLDFDNGGKFNLDNYVKSKVPTSIGFSLEVCDLNKTSCNLNSTLFKETLDLDVFVEETVISSNLTDYSPKKVRLFFWENKSS